MYSQANLSNDKKTAILSKGEPNEQTLCDREKTGLRSSQNDFLNDSIGGWLSSRPEEG